MKSISNSFKKQIENIDNCEEEDFRSEMHIIIQPINYPSNNKYINSKYFENSPSLFNEVVHDQWNGLEIFTGNHLVLFDNKNGYAIYKIISTPYEGLKVNDTTLFQVLNNDEKNIQVLYGSNIDFIKYITHSINIESKLITTNKITIKIEGYVNSTNYDDEHSSIRDFNLFKEYIREQ